ncbi:MAG: ferredoxin [Granulosicoccus sp.]|jgi:ferredoxin
MSNQEQTLSFVKNTSSVVQQQQLGQATSQIQYVSQGYCLVIGDAVRALECASPLAATGFSIVQIDSRLSKPEKQLTGDGIAVFKVPALELDGYLGAYSARVPSQTTSQSQDLDLAVSVYRESGYFDLVLDLSDVSLMPMRLAPFGYFHATTDEEITAAVAELVELTGEFEKPRYFSYNSAVCAHSRSELTGCSRCIDVCTTGAIQSDGEGVKVDPFLCQGCGSCATVCPSGAMTYAYPRPADAIDRTRKSLSAHQADTVVLHTEALQGVIDTHTFDDGVLPLLVEEVSAFGADYWLALLAGPASRIIIVLDSLADDPNRLAIESQLNWVEPLVGALGVGPVPISICASADLAQVLAANDDGYNGDSATDSEESLRDLLKGLVPQNFTTHGDKRQTLRMALDVFSEQIPPSQPCVELPATAPFGRINVDTEACTLCMACVSTCPAKALLDGQDTPALRFVEANCLQCGLCETACPESAISLKAQYTWDSIEARKLETLHEEAPFHCVRCHTAFTTQAMIDTMTSKLAGHWMFQDGKAVRRLKLCGECRVKDIFEEDAKGINVHRSDA